jgi:hypothetical protein
MATHTTTPAQTITTTSSPGQISVYGHPSPSNSATNTPASNSPTSPRTTSASLHQPPQSRQIRPPKAPLYVPAALRPTERPQKPSPLTPPRSVHGSLDSLNECESTVAPVTRQLTVDTNKTGISKLAEDAWMRGEHLGEVTGAPTRDHWKVSLSFPFIADFLFSVFVQKRLGRKHPGDVAIYSLHPRCCSVA